MKRAVTTSIAVAIAVLAPALVWASPAADHAAEHAGGHGEHGGGLVWVTWPPWGEQEKTGLLWIIINFAALLLILERLLFSKLRARTAQKHDLIKEELGKATSARSEAEAIIREYKDRMARLDGEVKELMDDAKRRAEADRVAIIKAAEDEAERIRASAKAAAEREGAARRRVIENEIVDRAIERAEQVIRERIGPGDQKRMFDDYISQLDQVQLGGRST